ncbi:MAG: GspH/FimT family pseudopilin [Pseudomonadota bacterium]
MKLPSRATRQGATACHWRGLTLVELLVTLAVLALLMALGVPSFQNFLARRAVSSQTDLFMSSLRFARTEAVKSGVPVTMCITTNADAASPTCSGAAGASGWASGWLIFADYDGDGTVDAQDVRLRVQQSLLSRSGGMSPSPANMTAITFRPNGLAPGMAGRVEFRPRVSSSSTEYETLAASVCMAITGRARPVNAVGGSACQ